MIRSVILSACCVLSCGVQGGVLKLTNGDEVGGNLSKIEGDNIVWASENFGSIKVAKSKVADMKLDGLFRLNGFSDACEITGFQSGSLQAVCGGKAESVELVYLDIAEGWVAPEARKMEYMGKASLTAQRKSGNENQEEVDLDIEQVWKLTDIEHELDIEYRSDSVDDQPAEDSHELRYQNNWFFKPSWYWANNLAYTKSEPKNIDEQLRAGTALGHVIWKDSRGELKGLLGLAYQETQFFPPTDPEEEDYLSASWALDFKYSLFAGVALFHNHQVYQSMDESDDLEAKAQTGFSMPLYNNIHGEAKHEWDYDRSPSAGTQKVDTRVTLGVSYNW